MAEVRFFGCREDTDILVQWIFEEGAWLIPDIHYRMSKYAEIHDLGAFERYRKQTNLFFILAKGYQRCPLELQSIEKRGKRFYFVMQRNGGPAIHLFCSQEFRERGVAFLGLGSLSYFPTFWNTITSSNERVPESLKLFYAKLLRRIKSLSKKTTVSGRVYHVGEQAQRLQEKGIRLDIRP